MAISPATPSSHHVQIPDDPPETSCCFCLCLFALFSTKKPDLTTPRTPLLPPKTPLPQGPPPPSRATSLLSGSYHFLGEDIQVHDGMEPVEIKNGWYWSKLFGQKIAPVPKPPVHQVIDGHCYLPFEQYEALTMSNLPQD